MFNGCPTSPDICTKLRCFIINQKPKLFLRASGMTPLSLSRALHAQDYEPATSFALFVDFMILGLRMGGWVLAYGH